MKPTTLICGVTGVAAWLLLGAGNLQGQNQNQDRRSPGNFDPQQMRQRLMDRMREQLEVKEDAEWKVVSDRITKVMEARRAVGDTGGRGGFGPGGGPPPMSGNSQRGPGSTQDNQAPPQPPGAPGDTNGGPSGDPPGFSREPNPELDALRKALDSKAPNAELKAKLTALREARQKKEADWAKAQDDLRQILSTRQEAIAVTLGLLK